MRGPLAYRKLFDASRGETKMTSEDMLAIGVQIRARHATGGKPGPLAVVVPPDKAALVSRVLGILADRRSSDARLLRKRAGAPLDREPAEVGDGVGRYRLWSRPTRKQEFS